MKVTDEQYNLCRETIEDIRNTLFKLDGHIGNVPMTIRFMRAINNLLGELLQMYFAEKDS